jgi:predicted MFS family arabinose efflux permease
MSPDPTRDSRTAWYTLTLLVAVYVFNFVDRNLLAILLNSIKQDLDVSDTAMGFMTGPAFALFYGTLGIPIARLADRRSRRLIISVGLALWSGMTAASGLVQNFGQLLAARIGVGVGEASATPASHSMISDLFPPARRATAMAVYNMGASLGLFAGMALGGWLNEGLGWRVAFIALGLPGVLLALMVRFGMREPVRGRSEGLLDSGEQPSFIEVRRYMLGRRSFRHVTAAASLYAMPGYAMLTWAPAFVERMHGMSTAALGWRLGLVTGIGGVVGALAGGTLADRLARRDERWLVWLPSISGTALIPFLAGFVWIEDLTLALGSLFFANLCNQVYAAPSYAVTQGLAKLRMRAMASAIILLMITLVGYSGPQLLGLLNDLLHPSFGEGAIRYSFVSVALVNLWAATHSLMAARTLRAELGEARRAEEESSS